MVSTYTVDKQDSVAPLNREIDHWIMVEFALNLHSVA